MRSPQGLKFALKSVKAEKKKQKKKNQRSAPKSEVMIVPPNTWDESSRKGFIEWGSAVGFGVRNAGGGVVFLVLKGDKVEAVHDTLEKAWKIMKERKNGGAAAKGPSPLRRRR